MSDHQDLHDAFAEYERRADAVGVARAGEARPGRTSRTPLLLVAASVALVLAVAGVVVWLAADNASQGHSGAPVGAPPGATGSATASPSTSAPVSSTTGPSTSAPVSGTASPSRTSPVLPVISAPASTAPPTSTEPPGTVNTPTSTASPTRTEPSGGASVPSNARQMTRALRRVLGDTATVRVDQHYGNYIIGILTTTSGGAEGGFDIQAAVGKPGDRATCEDPGKHSHCTIHRTADGGSSAMERESYGTDQLYFANYVFPDGATYLMHLSNRADPKGAGRTFGRTPPLTLRQVVGIVESDGWGQS